MPIPLDNFRSPAALTRFFLTTIVGLAADLATKAWAFATLADSITTLPNGRIFVDSRSYDFIPYLIRFDVTANQGAVFGIGQGQRWIFVIVSIGAIAFLSFLFANSGRQRLYQIVLGMLLAGVLGNLYDRITLGYVRDMIHAFPGSHWPGFVRGFFPNSAWARGELFPWIFNVADCLLCVGVSLMVIYSLFQPDGKSAGGQTTAATKADAKNAGGVGVGSAPRSAGSGEPSGSPRSSGASTSSESSDASGSPALEPGGGK
jgi:signal peptidase II